MPELPEVETVVQGLAPHLVGQSVAEVDIRRDGLRRPFPADLRQRLTGARILTLSRRAKYGLITSDRGILIFHLGMSGRWRIDAQIAEKHDHLRLLTSAGMWLALNDARRFGSVDWLDADLGGAEDGAQDYAPFAALGPEPLGPDFTADYLVAALRARGTPIKNLLLDQSIVAGLGNIYVCEALHIARISPLTRGGDVPRKNITSLVTAIRHVLTDAIAAGGSTIRDHRQISGELGYFSHSWRVYGRANQPCPTCAAPILRHVQSGRSSFYCAKCQK